MPLDKLKQLRERIATLEEERGRAMLRVGALEEELRLAKAQCQSHMTTVRLHTRIESAYNLHVTQLYTTLRNVVKWMQAEPNGSTKYCDVIVWIEQQIGSAGSSSFVSTITTMVNDIETVMADLKQCPYPARDCQGCQYQVDRLLARLADHLRLGPHPEGTTTDE